MWIYAAFVVGLFGGAALGGFFGFRYATALSIEVLDEALKSGKLVKGKE